MQSPPPNPPPSVDQDPSLQDPSLPLQDPAPDVDPQIIEALRSKDRIYVLKLGERMEALIADRKPRIDLMPSTSYQRLLVHRCSAYYRLLPENDPANKNTIFVVTTTESRIPARRLCDLVPPESTQAPAFKIMRRSALERRPNRSQSQAGSVAGDEGDFSDADPSESGSQGGRSNTTGRSNKSRMTIEEREAAYNEARSRIFMDFEEKEKEKDMSASSSSISLASGSTSGGGGSSISGDIDESVSSPATESEYSGPSIREKKDSRHLGRNGSVSSSSRSVRSGHYNSGQGSSRNSRAPSPSPFTYANIYEPNQTTYYDHSQQPPAGYNPPSQYMYPYPPSGMPPGAYYGGYPYYQYPYPSPPPHNTSDPSTPSSGDPYSGMYPHQYAWSPPPPHPMQSPPHMPHPPQMPPPGAPPPPMHSPPQYPYIAHPQPYAYSMPGYYPISGPPVESPPNQGAYDRSFVTHGERNLSETASAPGGAQRHGSVNGVRGRGTPAMTQGRGWSYGPGVGPSGHATSPTETVGPRLTSARRQSNISVTSRSSNGDDVSSTASSSTTSSSSRTASQHPLPARPDWAVGLKPQPTLHQTQGRHRDHSHSNSRTMSPISSPPRNLNGNGHHHHHPNNDNNNSHSTPQQQQQQPASLQSPTEFPPLSSGSGVAQERRMPVVSGAWGNNLSTRNIRLMSPGQGPQQQQPSNNVATALAHHPQQPAAHGPVSAIPPPPPPMMMMMDGAEDGDRAFERPPPKSSAELFNPKLLKRPAPGRAAAQLPPQERDSNQKERAPNTGVDLVEQVQALTLDAGSGSGSGIEREYQPKEALAV